MLARRYGPRVVKLLLDHLKAALRLIRRVMS